MPPRLPADYQVRQDEVDSLRARIDTIERRDLLADEVHKHLIEQDHEIRDAVKDLTFVIKDPEEGLIVQLREVKNELTRDRRIVIGVITVGFTIIELIAQVFAPAIRAFFHITGNVGG